MPGADELPPSLKDFERVNAAEIDNGHNFHHDVERLIRSIDDQTRKKRRWFALPDIPWRYAAYVIAAVLLSRLAYVEYVLHSGSLAQIDEFFSCGARVLYPSISFRDEVRVLNEEHVHVLAHSDHQAVVRLYSSPALEEEKISDVLDKFSKGATVSYRTLRPEEFGILTGWRPSRVMPNIQEEFYYRLQFTANKQFFVLYEMTHPPKDQSHHPYWNVNEILSRTLTPKGTLSDGPTSCDFRQRPTT
jgi:hypothetical protein